MSVSEAVARIAHLQSLLAGGGPVPPQAAPGAPGFDRQLAAASGAGGPSATAASGGAPVSGQFAEEINAAARRHRLDPALLRALIRAESNFNPNARSPAGALGLTQLMPGTARALGVSNPLDPRQAIDGGARYLRQMLDRFGGDVRRALAGYNAGPGAVQRHGGVPPYAETQNYVRRVLEYAEQYRRQATAAPAAAGRASALAGAAV